MPTARGTRAVHLLAAVAGLACVISAILLPTQRGSASVTWTASAGPSEAIIDFVDPLESIEVFGLISPRQGQPARVSTLVPGSVAAEDSVVLAVQADASGPRVSLSAPDGAEVSAVTLKANEELAWPWPWTVTYRDRLITLKSGDASVDLAIPEGRTLAFNGVHHEGATGGLKLMATSTAASLDRPSSWHLPLLLLGAILGFCALASLRPSKGLYGTGRLPRALRLHVSDALVVGATFVSAFVSRSMYDDGWVLQRARMVVDRWSPTGALEDSYEPLVYPQGFIYESLLGATFGHSTSIVGIRGLTVLITLSIWVVVSRLMLPKLGLASQSGLVVAGAFMSLWTLAWMTLRAEVPVALISVILLAIIASGNDGRVGYKLAGIVSLSGLGLATHQSGMVILVGAIPGSFYMLRSDSRNLREKLIGVITGSTFAVILVFLNQGLVAKRESLEAYGGPPLDVFNEWGRFSDLFRVGTLAQRSWFILGLIGLVVLWVAVANRLLFVRKWRSLEWTLVSAAVMPLGLAFTSSKWAWHYAALVAPMTLGIMLMARRVAQSHNQRSSSIAIALLVVFWITLSAKDSEFDRRFAWLIVTTTLLSVFFVWAWRSDTSSIARLGSALLATTLVVAATTAWNALDLHLRSTNGWSFVSQASVGLVLPSSRCGMSDLFSLAHIEPNSTTASHSSIRAHMPLVLQNPCLMPAERKNGVRERPYRYSIDPEEEIPSGASVVKCVDFPAPGSASTYRVCLSSILPPKISALPADDPARLLSAGAR